ncbi:MAG: maleylpyruvate isomerase family mycothiol-dependent enzyme [Aeromicrobium sp.]
MHPLEPYVQAWRGTAGDVIDLLPTLTGDDWSRPTDCPGWSVHDVAAHLAHLEAVLAGHEKTGPQIERDGDQVAADYTQAGVDARSDRTPDELIEEYRTAVEARATQLTMLPEGGEAPPITPGNAAWSWEVLLRNRSIDAWVHEQDIRRAVNRPGSLGTGGAQVTTRAFAAGMPYVLGKRVAPPAGTSVLWHVTGEVPLKIGAVIGHDGRAAAEVADDPTTTLSMTSEVFTILGAGRRPADKVEAAIGGAEELGRAVLGAMTLIR